MQTKTKRTLNSLMVLAALLAGSQAFAADEERQQQPEQRQEYHGGAEHQAGPLQVCFDQPRSFQRKPGDFARPGKYESRIN